MIRIPLVIFEPGASERRDVYMPTSATDVLPTLAHVNGIPVHDWMEGRILPPYGQVEDDRSIYAVYSPYTGKDQPMKSGSVVLIKGKYKLHYYLGYSGLEGRDLVLLYDLESDPEELNDLSASEKDIADEMLSEVKAKLEEVNKPYL